MLANDVTPFNHFRLIQERFRWRYPSQRLRRLSPRWVHQSEGLSFGFNWRLSRAGGRSLDSLARSSTASPVWWGKNGCERFPSSSSSIMPIIFQYIFFLVLERKNTLQNIIDLNVETESHFLLLMILYLWV